MTFCIFDESLKIIDFDDSFSEFCKKKPEKGKSLKKYFQYIDLLKLSIKNKVTEFKIDTCRYLLSSDSKRIRLSIQTDPPNQIVHIQHVRHDLKNRLNGISGYCQMIQISPKDWEKYNDLMMDEIDVLNKDIEDLITVENLISSFSQQ